MRINGTEVVPRITRYADGTLALLLDCAGRPYVKVSVNTEHILPEGFIAVKTWSENEGILETLIKEGVLGAEPLITLNLGYVDAPVHKVLAYDKESTH